MNLTDVNRGIHKHKKRKRVGRGPGSGHGKTSGRGHKGQGALAGWSASPIFEGGASPLIRRIPKRGFNNAWGKVVAAVNVGDLEAAYLSGEEVTLESLRAKNLAKGRYDELKILGDGELTKKLKITAHRFSQSALAKIEKCGGQAIVIPGKRPVVKGVAKRVAKPVK
ncbi:MAG: 50S ribosomal protein L15 [Planctomycetia bacterium]|nr:50S ribosomal protein L15 [Planctomycetia bacterium]